MDGHVTRRAAVAVLVGLLVQFLCARHATALTTDEAVGVLADNVVRYMQDTKKRGSIAIGTIQGTSTRFNVGIADMFRRHLKEKISEHKAEANGIQFADQANLVINGKYFAEEVDAKIEALIEIELVGELGTITDFREWATDDANNVDSPATPKKGKGDEGGTVVVAVDNPADVTEALGGSGPLTKLEDKLLNPTQEKSKQDERAKKAVLEPQASLEQDETLILAEPESPYKIKILAWDNAAEDFLPLPVKLGGNGGSPQVALESGQLYAIQIHNAADFDCAVRILIDGVNTLAYSQVTDYRERGVWMIPAGKAGLVKGFHHRNVVANGRLKFIYHGFLVTELPDEELQKDGRDPGKMGIISATFFPAWVNDRDRPKIAEPDRATPGTVPGEQLEGQGGQAAVKVDFDAPLAIISVRYTDPNPAALPKNLPPPPG